MQTTRDFWSSTLSGNDAMQNALLGNFAPSQRLRSYRRPPVKKSKIQIIELKAVT